MKKDVIILHEKMRQLTIEIGVKEQQYDSVIYEIDEYSSEELKKCYEWLWDVRSREYTNIVSNRNRDNVRALKRRWAKPYRTAVQLARIAKRRNPIRHRIV
jgi:hypothetical protein